MLQFGAYRLAFIRALVGGAKLSAHHFGLTRLARRRLGGLGFAILLHEVHADPQAELATGFPLAAFERLILWLRSEGFALVTLDELSQRLEAPADTTRCVAITFDDGYRDNVTHALPVLERHQAPFTVFVPSHAMTRELDAWWLAARMVFLARERVVAEPMDQILPAGSLAEKKAGLRAMVRWLRQNLARREEFDAVFAASGSSMAAINDRYFLSAAEVRTLSTHPLATIGAHTVTHRQLSMLPPESVAQEFANNRSDLEALTQRPVRHLAYPFGVPDACGLREAQIAARCGFASAFAVRPAPIARSAHAERWLLPRIDVDTAPTIATMDLASSGLRREKLASVGGLK